MKQKAIAFVAAVVALCLASASFAQSAGPRGQGQGQQRQGAGRMMMDPATQKKVKAAHDKVIKELKLTADQKKKVDAAGKKREAAQKKQMEKFQADRKAGKQVDRDKMRADGKKIRDTYNSEMKKAMGDAKFKTYEKRMGEEMKKIFEAAQKSGAKPGAKPGSKPKG